MKERKELKKKKKKKKKKTKERERVRREERGRSGASKCGLPFLVVETEATWHPIDPITAAVATNRENIRAALLVAYYHYIPYFNIYLSKEKKNHITS